MSDITTVKQSKKSDSSAKRYLVKYLQERGFEDVRIVKAPADVIAVKDGKQWYFEVKMTRVKGSKYFGAATLTEWEQALKDPDHFRFAVVHIQSDSDELISIKEFTPAEMLKYSTVPPFKVFFDVPMKESQTKKSAKPTKSVLLTEDKCQRMVDFYNSLK